MVETVRRDTIHGRFFAAASGIVSRLTVFTIAYNTNAVRKADAPKTYQDLLDPKWKGKLGIESDDGNWLMTVSAALVGSLCATEQT